MKYYDVKKTGEIDHKLLTADVIHHQPLMLQYIEHSARTAVVEKKARAANNFIPKPFMPVPNKAVENFKRHMKISLEAKMRAEGGSVRSILHKVFVSYDPHLLGKLNDWRSLQAAVRKFGLNISQEDAEIVFETFDKGGDKHFYYQVLADDLIRNDPGLTADASNVLDVMKSATARAPQDISSSIRKFRDAGEVYARKSHGGCEARDILLGTFIRFDSSRNGVRISLPNLKLVVRELNILISDQHLTNLLNWFDSDNSSRLDYAHLVKQIFGEDVLTRSVQLPTLNTSSSSMSMGMSSGTLSFSPVKEKNAKVDIKETKKQLHLKALSRQKLIVDEKHRIEAKLGSIEKQQRNIIRNKKNNL